MDQARRLVVADMQKLVAEVGWQPDAFTRSVYSFILVPEPAYMCTSLIASLLNRSCSAAAAPSTSYVSSWPSRAVLQGRGKVLIRGHRGCCCKIKLAVGLSVCCLLCLQALPPEVHCSVETFGSYRAGLHLPGDVPASCSQSAYDGMQCSKQYANTQTQPHSIYK